MIPTTPMPMLPPDEQVALIRKKKRIKLIIVCAIVFVLAIAGSVTILTLINQNKNQSPTNDYTLNHDDEALTTDVDNSTTYDKGSESVRFGFFDVSLDGVKRNYQPGGDAKATQGNEYVLVTLTATNADESDHYLSDIDFVIQKSDGSISNALIGMGAKPILMPTSLKPGASTSGSLLYEVPQSATGLSLYYNVQVYNEETQQLEKSEFKLPL